MFKFDGAESKFKNIIILCFQLLFFFRTGSERDQGLGLILAKLVDYGYNVAIEEPAVESCSSDASEGSNDNAAF